ncbi:30S ribosome-binding factor RbfA [Desulfocurvus vexinensis]|uniref:30S ribosome-binding factor RbfA n=1 Tax=Desulfocurvus vexinensis TaxID=399548 RepID=UPI000491F440|nr:30S ribosome-binding factor RbfA [Desulfocurvus vexinensis]
MHPSGSRRAHRMADQIMREVSEMLALEVADPRLAMITVSGARMNKDLSIAEVLYSAPAGADLDAVRAALDKAASYLRGGLGKRLKTKFIPRLVFVHDDYLEEMVYGKGPQAG